MKKVVLRGSLLSVSVLGAMVVATPASAAATICTGAQLANAVGATSCYFVAGNANGNSIGQRTDQIAAIGALNAPTFVYNNTSNANNSFLSGSLHTSLSPIGFGTPLIGETIVSMHFGGGRNSPFGQGPGGFTAFYLFNFAAPTNSLTLLNSNSLSNAHLFAVGQAVPEPATWALLILGFGAVGVAMRSRRQKAAFAF